MTVLGIETSTAVCSVGFVGDRGTRIQKAIIEAHIHSEKLLALIEEVTAEGGGSLSSVDAIAVSHGPGSFTGLRIGLSSAKGLCYALAKPLVTVPTFQAIAAAAFRSDASCGKILVALDAKKGDFYVGLYANTPDVKEVEGAVLSGIEGIVRKIRSEDPDIIVTDKPEMFHEVVMKRRPRTAEEFLRGDIVAELGLRKLAKGETADLSAAEPLYLKDFVVQGGRGFVSK